MLVGSALARAVGDGAQAIADSGVIALDQDTGKQVWQFKTGSSINAPPITYTYKGRQYVTVLSGRGGSVAGRFITDSVPAGGSVWTFALMPD